MLHIILKYSEFCVIVSFYRLLTQANYHMADVTTQALEFFDNPKPDRDYTIRIETPEFTCLCPVTGQPDFATIQLHYVPNTRCVELKSYKLYLWAYRNAGAFHEAVTNQILDHLVDLLAPRFLRVEAKFNVRGGIYTTVVAEHRDAQWQPPVAITLP